MEFLQKAVFRLSKLAAQVSALLLALMVGHILLEIVLRTVFDTSTFILDEYVGYGVAAITYLALAYSLEEGSLIRVNVLLARLRGRPRRLVELFCIFSSLAVFAFVAAYFWRNVARNWERGAVSESLVETPLWIPELVVFVGVALFLIQLLAYLLRILSGEEPAGTGRESGIADKG